MVNLSSQFHLQMGLITATDVADRYRILHNIGSTVAAKSLGVRQALILSFICSGVVVGVRSGLIS